MDSSTSFSDDSGTCKETKLFPCDEKIKPDPYEDKALPPIDGGIHAWLFLAASAMIEALVWGFAFSFGVFQSYYHDSEVVQDSNMVAVIGTCATGVAYMSCPLVITTMILLPRTARWFSTLGLSIMCLSLAMGSFSTNFTHLVLSQGVGFGIGGCIAYSPSILYMSEWFDKRRGLAFGIVWAGSGLSGVLIPLALEKFLGQYGFRTTLRIFSVLIFVLAAPFLYYHKSRLPVSREVKYDRLNARFLCSRVSIIYQLGNIAEALGFFLPAIYLPTLARTLGASDFLASLTVTALNLASVFGSVSMGFLSDRCHTLTCILISTAGTVLSIFLIWGFSTTIPVLIVFGVAYGVFAGSYSAIWSGMIREIQKDNPSADATIIFSTIAFGRGVGNVVSGPFSEALLRADSWQGHAMGAYGSGFGFLIVCTGLTAVLGGLSLMARCLRCI